MTTALTAIIGVLLLACAALLNLWQSARKDAESARKERDADVAEILSQKHRAENERDDAVLLMQSTAETLAAYTTEANKRINFLHQQLDIVRGLTPEREKAAASELDEAFGRG